MTAPPTPSRAPTTALGPARPPAEATTSGPARPPAEATPLGPARPLTEAPPPQPLRLAVILGSVREGRFADTIAAWLVPQLRRLHDGELDVIDLRDAGLSFGPSHVPAPLPAGAPSFEGRVRAADAFVFVVPEYNHSFPAALKAAVDSAYAEWNAKPAAFVSYGGISGGLRAVEQLRLVLGELHVAAVRDGVCFPNARGQFDAEGRPRDAERAERALRLTLRELAWWGQALKAARLRQPYGDWA